jgi:hypothetical protein
MNTVFPSLEEVRAGLQGLRSGELDKVAKASGVPAATLWKIRIGETTNPGLETVRKFFHLLPSPAANDPHSAQVAEQGASHG